MITILRCSLFINIVFLRLIKKFNTYTHTHAHARVSIKGQQINYDVITINYLKLFFDIIL